MNIKRTGGLKWLSSIKWGIWALLGAEEEAPLVQGLGGKILMLEALSVVCHPRKTDGGRVRSHLVLFYLLSATCTHTHTHTHTDIQTHTDTQRQRHTETHI